MTSIVRCCLALAVCCLVTGSASADLSLDKQFEFGVPTLNNPYNTEVDSAGNLYINDSNMIRKYSSDRVLLTSWAKQIPGGRTGPIYGGSPGLAIDSDDNIYSAVYSYGEVFAYIQKFDSDGNFLLEWGGDASSSNTNGLFRTECGSIRVIEGNVWVGDKSGRMQKFDSSGNYLDQITGMGTFPRGIAQRNGNYYIGEYQSSKVYVFSAEGVLQTSWSAGTGTLRDMVIDSQDNVYTSHQFGGVYVYTLDGVQQASVTTGANTGTPVGLWWGLVLLETTNTLLVTDPWSNVVHGFLISGLGTTPAPAPATVSPTTSPTTTPTVSPTTSPTTTPTVSPTTSPTTICDLRVDSDDIEKTWMSEYTISDGVVTVKVQEELEWIIENEEPTLTGQMVACISGFAWSYAEEGCDYREWTGAIGINALLQCSSGVAEDVSVVDGPDISRMRVEFEMSSLRNVEYYMAGVGDPTSIITTRNTLMPMLFDFQKTINVESQNIAVTSMYFPVTEVVATLTGSDDGEPLTDDEKDEITNSIAAHFNFPSAAIKFTFAESGSIVVTAQVPSDVSTTCAALTFTSFSAVVECAVGEDFASIREVTERSVISVGWTEGSISGLTAEANLKVYTNMQVPYELVNPQHKNQNSALTYSAFETTGTCSLNVDCEKYFKWTLTDDHASPVCTFSGSYEVEFDVVCSQEYNGYVCPLIGNETITTTVSLESGYHCPDTENAVDIALLATELFSNRVDSDDSETVTDSFLNTQTLKFHADVRADNAGLKDAKFIAISIADVNGGVDLELYNGGLTDSGTLLALAVTDIIDSTTDPESDSSVLSPSFTLIADADTLGLDLQETAVFQVTATIAAVYEADGVRRRALLQVSYDASTETSRTVIISAEDAAMQVLEESAAHNNVSAGLWLALLLSVYTAFALHF